MKLTRASLGSVEQSGRVVYLYRQTNAWLSLDSQTVKLASRQGWFPDFARIADLMIAITFVLLISIAQAYAQSSPSAAPPPSSPSTSSPSAADFYGERLKERHAFVVGVADYPTKNGISKLTSPVYDAQELKKKLQLQGIDFVVDLRTNGEVADKEKFLKALDQFLARVRPNDEVLFYFSGHGYSEQEAGNFFLLASAKSQTAYLRSLPRAEVRALKSKAEKRKKYTQWLKTVAVSEKEIEDRIYSKANPETLIIIADACRNLLAGRKGVEEVTGIALPQQNTRGTFRLYSASLGQLSFDSREKIKRKKLPKATVKKRKGKRKKRSKKHAKVTTSLFTSILLSELAVPRQEINIMVAKIKIEVREQALRQGGVQVPDFSDDIESTNFYFWRGGDSVDYAARCQTADAELAQLQYGVRSGSISPLYLERQKIELAPCGTRYAEHVETLIRLQKQGAGALSTKRLFAAAPSPGLSTPDILCDHYAASPLDSNRPQNVSGVEIHKIAINGLAGDKERKKAIIKIRQAIDYCEDAVKMRSRVARFKYNLARANYALSSLTKGDERVAALKDAAEQNQQAVNLGYAAAYNALALLHQKGEFYKVDQNNKVHLRSNRIKARELLKRGADRGHTLAHYNLGLAYKHGDLGLVNKAAILRDKAGLGRAFQHFSKAAEAGFVPAIIETALALRYGHGIDRPNKSRAIKMLKLAASRGSWEAMYQLGEIHYNDLGGTTDKYEAIIWYARAAEAGDTRSQAKVAGMLTSGEGLPAPQREPAGRYWRLAADGGDKQAQMMLADLLASGKIPFRPKLDGPPDGGAQEIKDLYSAAFARGNPHAGLKLARLYRTGFPRQVGSKAIPISAETAIKLFWQTIEQVRSAAPHTNTANPRFEILAAHELIDMQDKSEAKHRDGTPALTEDEIALLRLEYGDPSERLYIYTSAIARRGRGINCGSSNKYWVLVWNWGQSEPPTTRQFDWFERKNNCRDRILKALWDEYDKLSDKKKKRRKKPKLKAGTWGITKNVRNVVAKEYKAYKSKKNKISFTERMRRKVSRR